MAKMASKEGGRHDKKLRLLQITLLMMNILRKEERRTLLEHH